MNNLGLKDSFNRTARKLRISVTDRCNMRCAYCMPSKNVEWFKHEDILSFEEIIRLANIFVDLGIQKIRITGGEPTIRDKIENLVSKLSSIKGIKVISMTSNGLLFSEKVKKLKEAGLDSVNISLDTFRADRFKAISGIDGLDKVLLSIKTASENDLTVKINTVVMRNWNSDEVSDFAIFARETGHIVKFIEFMPLDGTGIWSPDLVVSKEEMINNINKNVNELVPLHTDSSETTRLYSFADGIGKIGFIPSITEPFCRDCDRIRLTSDGKFLTCLFENPGYDLKKLLRSGIADEEIKNYIINSTKKKPEGIINIIRTDKIRPTLNFMNRIGG